MSPEQKKDPESTSYPSDIYSFGIITYELVLGKMCHGQIHLSLMPKGLQKILTKTLQLKPEDRYQDIVDFMTDVSAYLHSPALLKENKELDPLSDLSESLRNAQHSLVPEHAPIWPKIDIGISTYKSLGISSFYYDFFSLPHENYGIIIGEPSVKGSPGIVYSSVLRGMVRALSQLTHHPQEMAKVLNALLLDDPMKQQFSFSYLIFSPRENLFRFISCNCGHFWYRASNNSELEPIISTHSSLGADSEAKFTEIEHPWYPGDTVIFYASFEDESTKHSLFTEEQFQVYLEETPFSSPQKQVDSILRKAKVYLSRITEERCLVLVSVFRKD